MLGHFYSVSSALPVNSFCDGLYLVNRVCIIGGSRVGLETAMFIAESGMDVTVIEMEKDVGRELSHLLKTNLVNLLDEKNANNLTGHAFKEINKNGLIIESKKGEFSLACDDVISATGLLKTDVRKHYRKLCDLGLDKHIVRVEVIFPKNFKYYTLHYERE